MTKTDTALLTTQNSSDCRLSCPDRPNQQRLIGLVDSIEGMARTHARQAGRSLPQPYNDTFGKLALAS